MRKVKVCVCVPTYNQQAYIAQCLHSILSQEVGADIEVIVGDDASTDGTSDAIDEMVAKSGGRLKHLRRSANIGAFDNMRDLLQRATGDYVARVDGDDFWLPRKLARQLAYIQASSNCSAVYTNAITIDEAGRRVGLFNDLGDTKLDLAGLLRRGNVLNNSSMLYRGASGIDWHEGDRIDYQNHLWLAREGWLGHIGEPLVGYRVGSHGSLVLKANERIRQLYWQAIQSVPRELVNDHDYACAITDFLRRVCFRAVRTQDVGLAYRWAATVYAASPFGKLHTSWLVFENLARMSKKLLGVRVARLFRRGTPDILYRH